MVLAERSVDFSRACVFMVFLDFNVQFIFFFCRVFFHMPLLSRFTINYGYAQQAHILCPGFNLQNSHERNKIIKEA